jgi:hypothetical protein
LYGLIVDDGRKSVARIEGVEASIVHVTAFSCSVSMDAGITAPEFPRMEKSIPVEAWFELETSRCNASSVRTVECYG